jgi:hypothetical protein
MKFSASTGLISAYHTVAFSRVKLAAGAVTRLTGS